MAEVEEVSENPPSGVSSAVRRYTLTLLFLAYVFNYIDRQIVTILQEPIKAELGLSDTQLGLLTGFSFALFYAFLGIPIARLADHRSRKKIVASSIAVWSAMTALCATAGSYASLLLFRVGVGVGEAGLSPPAHSMISDLYPPEKRAAAFAIYSTGIQVGVMIGFLAGGWINHYFGWRAAFLLVGLPGLLLAALIALTLKEPVRGLFDGKQAVAPEKPDSIWSTLKTLWAIRSFRYISLAAGVHALVLYGHGNWMPPFLSRNHGMNSAEIGTMLALLAVIPGAAGIFLSGYMADFLARYGERARIWVPAVSVLLSIPAEAGMLMAETQTQFLCFAVVNYFFGGVYLAPSIALCHSVVAPHMRASASALFLFLLNLIGLGAGPVIIGLISDSLTLGVDRNLQVAMLAVIPCQLVAVWLLVLAYRNIRRDKPEIEPSGAIGLKGNI